MATLEHFIEVIKEQEPHLNREAVRRKARQQLKRFNKVGR